MNDKNENDYQINTDNNNNDIIMEQVENPSHRKFLQLKEIFTTFLKNHTIYETVPENMKILVFNSELTIKDSIEAMIKEDIYCGLLWDTSLAKYIGLFTIRDVLNLIIKSYAQCLNYLNKHTSPYSMQKAIDDFFKKTEAMEGDNKMEIDDELSKINFDEEIKNFCQFLSLFDSVSLGDYIRVFKDKNREMIKLNLDSTLEECITLIRKNKIHRLVVEDLKSATLTGFITYEAIFEFFIENYYSEMSEFDLSLDSIDLVSKDVICLDKKDTIYKCLETLYEKKISLLPILDKDNNNEIFGYLYLKDLIYMFSGGEKFSFNDSVESLLTDLYDEIEVEKPLGKDRIVEVNGSMKMKEVFEVMSICPERKLIVRLSSKDIGVITLTNIFSCLVD